MEALSVKPMKLINSAPALSQNFFVSDDYLHISSEKYLLEIGSTVDSCCIFQSGEISLLEKCEYSNEKKQNIVIGKEFLQRKIFIQNRANLLY